MTPPLSIESAEEVRKALGLMVEERWEIERRIRSLNQKIWACAMLIEEWSKPLPSVLVGSDE